VASSHKSLLRDQVNPNFILTPKINEYLMEHGNDPVRPDIMDRVAAELTKPGRDRSGTFSASATQTCLRRQEFEFLGKPHSDTIYPGLQHVFTLGTWVGQQWGAMLLQADLIEDIEVTLPWGKYRAQGSADGVGYVWWETVNPNFMNRGFIWENKTVGAHTFKQHIEKGVPMAKHIGQVTRYALVGGYDLAVITYVDKGNVTPDGWYEFVVEITPEMKEQSLQELIELNKAVDNKRLHPILPGCKIKQGDYKTCPFGAQGGICLKTRKWG
jgi:hypothetical protein